MAGLGIFAVANPVGNVKANNTCNSPSFFISPLAHNAVNQIQELAIPNSVPVQICSIAGLYHLPNSASLKPHLLPLDTSIPSNLSTCARFLLAPRCPFSTVR